MDLNGAAILVTRPEQQAGKLCELIEQHNGVAVRFPVLEIVPVTDIHYVKWALNHLDYDWVVFISRNAVNFALKSNNGKIVRNAGVRFAAIGRSTADALKEADLMVDLIPKQGFNSEAMLMESEFQQIDGSTVLIVRGQGGREYLADNLRRRGAKVEYLEVYKRILPKADVNSIIARLNCHKINVITITSGDALTNLVDLVGKKTKSTLLTIPLVVIGDRIKQMAKKIGFTKIAVSAEPSDLAIVETVTALINGE